MKILMIGNGFDLEHYLPTKYTQFLEFVKKYRYAYLSANSVPKRLYDINDTYLKKIFENPEYDDGTAVINGKVVDMKNEAELRIRYLTPYNFIICAQFNPVNEKNDSIMKIYIDGILQGRYSINDIVKFEMGFTDIKETCNLEY